MESSSLWTSIFTYTTLDYVGTVLVGLTFLVSPAAFKTINGWAFAGVDWLSGHHQLQLTLSILIVIPIMYRFTIWMAFEGLGYDDWVEPLEPWPAWGLIVLGTAVAAIVVWFMPLLLSKLAKQLGETVDSDSIHRTVVVLYALVMIAYLFTVFEWTSSGQIDLIEFGFVISLFFIFPARFLVWGAIWNFKLEYPWARIGAVLILIAKTGQLGFFKWFSTHPVWIFDPYLGRGGF